MYRILTYFILTGLFFGTSLAENNGEPKVLCVIAHPDDEVAFAGTLYKIVHDLNGSVDIIIITNGEAGYKYSTLAEPIYCLKLTDEALGRNYLPFIRKLETLNAGKILGVHNYNFLDQKDTGYTLDMNEVFRGIWIIPLIKDTLLRKLNEVSYDFVFTLLPTDKTHGHHKAATLLALEAVNIIAPNKRPIILAVPTPDEEGTILFSEMLGYPLTKMREKTPMFKFNKMQPIGYDGKLNYQVIVNWVIAEHKSQGELQVLMNKGTSENFYYFTLNGDRGLPFTKKLFEKLNPALAKKRVVYEDVDDNDQSNK
jgi:N-acetylglucosamine malate deacetylase 2